MIINENDVCKCGCFWNGNGACSNGHWKTPENSGYMLTEINGKYIVVKNDNPSHQALIEIKINSGNTPMQETEESYLKKEIYKLVKSQNMRIEDIKVYR